MEINVQRRYVAILTISKLLLLCILACFQSFPLLSGNDDITVINTVNMQISRVEYFAQAVLVLTYRPQTFHSEAVSGMQINLPVLQQTQNGLVKGDASLGLPSNPADDVLQPLIAMQPDYNAFVAALKTILAHPDSPPDPIQVDIVMQHTQPYAIGLYQISLVLTKHAENKKLLFFILEIGLVTIIFLDVSGGYFFLIRPIIAGKEINVSK